MLMFNSVVCWPQLREQRPLNWSFARELHVVPFCESEAKVIDDESCLEPAFRGGKACVSELFEDCAFP